MKMSLLEKRFVNSPGHTREVADRASGLLSRVAYRSSWRYLDVGCGVGTAARRIAATTGMSVAAVDIDPAQIAAATSQPPLENLNYLVMDAANLEFPDREFDLVSCRMATHHIPDWSRAIVEMARVLRSGGYLLYTDIVLPPWLPKLRRCPTSAALDRLAAAVGLVQLYKWHKWLQTDIIWRKAYS